MIFTPAPQNGITPASTTGTIQSNFILIASSTATSYGKPVVLKAISDAAVYKENPVTFYSRWNNGSTTTTITLGTSSFINVSSCPFVLKTLQTGTHNIYAVWPGQGRFAGQTTIHNSTATVSVASGANLGGTFNIISSVPSGTAIAGETPVTFEAILSTSTFVTGSFVFYEDHTQLGSVTIFENAGFLTVPYLDPGTHLIEAVWAGSSVDGTTYQGVSTSTTYTVLAGRDSHAGLSLTFTPSYGVYREGNIQMVATLTTSTSLPGNISFYDDANVLLGSVPVVNNQADFTIFNNLTTGTYTYTATWDGNQTSTPRYLILTTSSNLEILAKEIPDTLYLTINPNPSSYQVNTVFTAYFTATTSAVYTGTVVFFDGNTPIGSATLTNNTAVFQSISLAPGSYAISAYYPGSNTTPKYYSTESNTVNLSVATGRSFPQPLTLNLSNESYLGLNQYVAGYPVYFKLTQTTSTVLAGQETFIVQNYQPLTTGTFTYSGSTNTSLLSYTYLNTGTQTVYGLWQGGQEGANFYAAQRTTTTVFTITNAYTISLPFNVDVTHDYYQGGIHAPYVTGVPQKITAALTTSSNFTGPVDFYVNNNHIGTSTFVNSSASIATSFISSGTYTIYAVWGGGVDGNSRPFNGETSTQFTLTTTGGYTLGAPITITVRSSDPASSHYYLGDTQTLTAATTASHLLNGPFNFYDNGNFIGTATFSNSTTTSLTYALSSGTNTITGLWYNGTADGTYPFYNVTATSSTATVILGSTVSSTLSVAGVNVVNEKTTLKYLTDYSQVGRTVNFYQTIGGVPQALGSQTISSTGSAFLSVPVGFDTIGTVNLSAGIGSGFANSHVWYYATTATTTSTVLAANTYPNQPYLSYFGGRASYGGVTLLNWSPLLITVRSQGGSDPAFAPGIFSLIDVDSGQVYYRSTATSTATVFSGYPDTDYYPGFNSWNNNTNQGAQFAIPPNTFNSGTYHVKVVWSSPYAPKYFPVEFTIADSRNGPTTSTSNLVVVGRSSLKMTPTTSTVVSASTATLSVQVTGYIGDYRPVESFNLYDGPNLISYTTVTNWTNIAANTYRGTLNFTWNPTSAGEIGQGTRTLTVGYGGSLPYNQATTSTRFTA